MTLTFLSDVLLFWAFFFCFVLFEWIHFLSTFFCTFFRLLVTQNLPQNRWTSWRNYVKQIGQKYDKMLLWKGWVLDERRKYCIFPARRGWVTVSWRLTVCIIGGMSFLSSLYSAISMACRASQSAGRPEASPGSGRPGAAGASRCPGPLSSKPPRCGTWSWGEV